MEGAIALLTQAELFSVTHNNSEVINPKDYVYVKKEITKTGNIIPINLYRQGYVTKIEVNDGKRLCHVFFGRRIEKFNDEELTKRI